MYRSSAKGGQHFCPCALSMRSQQWLGRMILFFLAGSIFAFGQPEAIHINEVMSSNIQNVADEDGGYPDWIEIYNAGVTTVDLHGYGLSDKADNPFKWQFPAVDISPASHLLVFASGKDRKPLSLNSANHWETLISWGDDWKYFFENTEPPPDWRGPARVIMCALWLFLNRKVMMLLCHGWFIETPRSLLMVLTKYR